MIGKIRQKIRNLYPWKDRKDQIGQKSTVHLQSYQDIAPDIEVDSHPALMFEREDKSRNDIGEPMVNDDSNRKTAQVRSRSKIVKFAYRIMSSRSPKFIDYKPLYDKAGFHTIYEAYLSASLFLSLVLSVPAFTGSFVGEYVLFSKAPLELLLVGSAIISAIVFGISLVLSISYPMIRARSFKSRLENELAYTFGILGVLSAAGISLERLFERMAASELNPVLAELARRFVRNVTVFGMDSEKALKEVAEHSPSPLFAKMLQSISVAYKNSGTIQDLVTFESSRLLQEKRDSLRKTVSSLSVLAELYITLVVVGPIIFIVMMAIFGLLPQGGLPSPVSIINLIVFFAVPVFSIMFLLLLDPVVAKA